MHRKVELVSQCNRHIVRVGLRDDKLCKRCWVVWARRKAACSSNLSSSASQPLCLQTEFLSHVPPLGTGLLLLDTVSSPGETGIMSLELNAAFDPEVFN